MKKLISILLLSLLLFSCNSEPTLQKYFVENSESSDFISVDISPSVFKVQAENLTSDQKKALESFEKMNVLAFKLKEDNQPKYELEKEKVTTLLKKEKYQELMKFGSGKEGVAVYFIGTDEKVDEFIIYGKESKSGFALVRILGENMNPSELMSMLSLLKESNLDMDQLKPLQGLIK